MNFKKIPTCLLIIPLAMQLASCKNISPRPLSTLTPTATAVPSETSTPQPTGTNAASPTPEITLIGLAPSLEEFPVLTKEQALEHLQKAIDSRSLLPKMDNGNPNSRLVQFTYLNNSNNAYGTGVTLECRVGSGGCAIVDSFSIQTADGVLDIVLLEKAETLEDGTQTSIIYPFVLTMDQFDPAADPDQYTRNRLNLLLNVMNYKQVMNYIHIPNEYYSNVPKVTNPALQAVLESAVQEGSRTKELLDKMYRLAKDNKSLSQDEINELFDSLALIWD
jgi:hypothetical protein